MPKKRAHRRANRLRLETGRRRNERREICRKMGNQPPFPVRQIACMARRWARMILPLGSQRGQILMSPEGQHLARSRFNRIDRILGGDDVGGLAGREMDGSARTARADRAKGRPSAQSRRCLQALGGCRWKDARAGLAPASGTARSVPKCSRR